MAPAQTPPGTVLQGLPVPQSDDIAALVVCLEQWTMARTAHAGPAVRDAAVRSLRRVCAGIAQHRETVRMLRHA